MNPPSCWDQFNPDFWDQNYPNPTKKFRKPQTQGLIRINNKIRLCDPIQFLNHFFYFEIPIFKIWSNPIAVIRSDYFWKNRHQGPVFQNL